MSEDADLEFAFLAFAAQKAAAEPAVAPTDRGGVWRRTTGLATTISGTPRPRAGIDRFHEADPSQFVHISSVCEEMNITERLERIPINSGTVVVPPSRSLTVDTDLLNQAGLRGKLKVVVRPGEIRILPAVEPTRKSTRS